MRNYMQPNNKPLFTMLKAIALTLLFNPIMGWGQWTFNTATGATVTVNTNTGSLCAGSGQGYVKNGWSNSSEYLVDLAYNNVPQGFYLKATKGVPVTLDLTLTAPGNGWFFYNSWTNGNSFNLYSGTDGGKNGFPSLSYLYFTGGQHEGTSTWTATVNFPKGTDRGYIIIKLTEVQSNTNNWGDTVIILPFIVEGVMDPEVPVLGVTTVPQIPFMILHDPPGDGSFSTFQDNKETCRSYEDTYAIDESNSIHGEVKIGTKGSVGLIVEVEYEAYIQFTSSGNIGNLGIKTTSSETCFQTGTGFSTSDLPGAEDGGDVFIGYGRDLEYGKYKILSVDNCAIMVDSGLVFVPVEGSERKFVYTKTAIQNEIVNLEALMADTSLNVKARNEAQNQIDVWNQILQLNEDNKNNPANEVIEQLSYSAGNTQVETSSVSIVDTRSITAEHYIEATAGIEGLVEVAGSGVSGGWEYATTKTFGETQNQTVESAQILEYTLTDDDAGDIFQVDVLRDPMYGTPVFKLRQGTQSSCPYEGGYQRDQPRLKHHDLEADHITLEDNPVGGAASFKVDLCNDSNQPRTYNLKLNAQSNLSGAVVTAAGVPLNGNDLGQEFTVPANSCLQELVIHVSMQNGSSELAYPNLEIFLYPPCDPDFQSSIFASVYFEDTTPVEDLSKTINHLKVFPNPAAYLISVEMELTKSQPIRLNLYDALGRPAITGHEEQLPAGNHQLQMEVDRLPPGLYTLQVRSDDRKTSRKVMVAR